jgi:hypothetical protein
VEEANMLTHFIPRTEHGNDSQEQREEYEQQTQPIQAQVKANAELRNPVVVQLDQPLASSGFSAG